MKHLFIFIDKLIVLLNDPRIYVGKLEDRAWALDVLDQIVKYTRTIKTLIHEHKNEECMARLRKAHIAEIEGWEAKVDDLFKTLDILLAGLDEYTQKLRQVIDHEPEKWGDTVGNLAMRMVMIGLHDEKEEMQKLRELEILEKRRLKSIIQFQEHVAELFE